MTIEDQKAKALTDLKEFMNSGPERSWEEAADIIAYHSKTIYAALIAEVTQPDKPVAWGIFHPNGILSSLVKEDSTCSAESQIRPLYTHPDRTSEALLAASAMLDKIERVVGGTIINRETGESFTVVDLDVIRKAIHQHEAKP